MPYLLSGLGLPFQR